MESDQIIAVKTSPEAFNNFIDVDCRIDSWNVQTDYLGKMRDGVLGGAIFRNVVGSEIINSILGGLNIIPKSELVNCGFAKLYPAPFAAIDGTTEGASLYFDSADKFESLVQESRALKLLSEQIEHFFHLLVGNRKFTVPTSKKTHQKGTLATLRFFVPGGGGLHVHCGHSTHEVEFYNEIKEHIVMQPQLSFFLVLQDAEEGGGLTVYDLMWKNGMAQDKSRTNDFVYDEKGNKVFLNNIETLTLNPLAGDLLVFRGGDIWHRVEEIKGSKERITFGGFINFSKGGDTCFVWS